MAFAFKAEFLLEEIMKVSAGMAESSSVCSTVNNIFTAAFEYQTDPNKSSADHKGFGH